ncbi:MAG: hypothetical protein K2K09_04505, partial [Lachnospiraceae bacterium]|nr:hypothetical protein [Lachnospiraceae bacterium]
YNIIINGLADLAGNKMEADTSVQVEKEKSIPVEFVPRSERAPAGQGSFDVYFYVSDQYGQQCDVMSVISDGELAAEAKTANGMLFQTKLNLNEGYVTVAGSPSAFAEGKVIEIVLTYTADGQTVCESVMHITMADAAGLGKPVEFEGLYAVSGTMENTGTSEAPEFVLTNTEKNNVFDVSARFRDEFGYAVDNADVTYMIDDKSVLAFADNSGNNSEDYNTSDHGVTVKALAGGTATITAYLSADDSYSTSMTVIVKPTNLSEIKVDKIDEGINGQARGAMVTLIPGGSGITADALKYDVIKGEGRIKEIKFVQEKDGIYVYITANTDSLDDDIQFRVRYNMGTEDESDDVVSGVVTYKSVPLATPASIEIDAFETVITAGGEASTSYRLLNRYGEDITKLSSKQPESRIGNNNLIKDAIIGTDDKIGILTVQAQPNEGETDIELYMVSNPSVSASVHVEVQKIAHVDKIVFAMTPSKGNLALNDTDNIIYAPIEV